ncbi:hypothetical protein AC1031_020548 [Aphanomyces cochlioides]|nr:hypothetical protein AC1031_020548 [Aphanomyces cochlioides]
MVETTTEYHGFWADLFNGEAKPGQLTDANGTPISLQDLNHIVLVLMSAYWCPPCRALTPLLIEFAQDNKDEVSVVYLSRDYNQKMFDFNLSTKPYNRFSWNDSFLEVFKQLKAAYPSILGIPTLFAVDRDSGKVLAQRAAVSIRSRPASVISEWKNGQDITEEEENAWWDTQRGDIEPVGILPILPLDTIVDAQGNPVSEDSLKQFIVLFFGATWAYGIDAISPQVTSFAKDNADDVSLIYFSLEDEESESFKPIEGTDVLRFKWSPDLRKIAYNADKIMTKDNPRNTLAAPRVLVYEKSTHTLVGDNRYGITINPTTVLDAWKKGDAGVTREEISEYFARKHAEAEKKQAKA